MKSNFKDFIKRIPKDVKIFFIIGIVVFFIIAAYIESSNRKRDTAVMKNTISTDAPKPTIEPTSLATPTPSAVVPSDAIELYYKKVYDNARDYEDKNVKFSAKISSIEYDCFTVYEEEIYVTLADEMELKNLKEGQYVTVVGMVRTYDSITNAVVIERGEEAKDSMEEQKVVYNKEKEKKAKKAAARKKEIRRKFIKKVKSITKDSVGDKEKIKNITLKYKDLHIRVDISRKNPSTLSLEDIALARTSSITDEILNLEKYDDLWDTITIDFGAIGYIRNDKSNIGDDGYGRYFISSNFKIE